MSLFNLPVEKKPKPPISIHPWAKTIKDYYANRIKLAHNSIRNDVVVYPKPKVKIPNQKRKIFTIFGNRVTKEFIYCVNLAQGMHKYRWKDYDTPVIRGCSGVEWPELWHDLKVRYGGLAYCIKSQVAVICDDQFIGGEEEFKDMIESRYSYHLALHYQKESLKHFKDYLKSSGRPCAYMHISIDENPVGTLIFMLYSDVAPVTCENFLRLCQAKKGGYSGTPVHRIVREGWIQCGGFGLKNTDMQCENFIVPHDKRGVLGMANAGRDIECSMQFYVLLQPHEWMKSKFVAFGQLIDGEETLKKIEEVKTYYEAPASNIIIYKAGLINFDCRDIKINKGTMEYLDGHIDDLVTIGEMFYEMLMERTWLEIQFIEIQKLLPPETEGQEGLDEAFKNTVDAEGNVIKKNIEATRRFIRKKNVEKQIEADANKSKTPSSRKRQSPGSASVRSVEGNDEFDVDTYEYKPEEEYTYDQVTPSSYVEREERKYFIPWTDVPYPGEVDSNFDLRRMLQGDYCLETDLDPKQTKLVDQKQWQETQYNILSDIINSYGGLRSPSSSSNSSDTVSIDSDETREIEEYLRINGEKVSYSGKMVRQISRAFHKVNPLIDNGPTECFTEADMRMMRLALQDFKMRQQKKISFNPINSQPWATPTTIKRRQTGFLPELKVRVYDRDNETGIEEEEEEEEQTELKSMMKSERTEEGDEEEEFNETVKVCRNVSIDSSMIDKTPHQIDRRQTGYFRPNKDLEPEEQNNEKVTGTKSSVRIASTPKEAKIIPSRRSMLDSHHGMDDYRKQSQVRPSVLVRLLEDLAVDDEKEAPTLKTYEPHELGKRQIKLAMSDSEIQEYTLLHRDTMMTNELKISFDKPGKDSGVLGRRSSVKRTSTPHYQSVVAEMGKARERDDVPSLQTERWKKRRPFMTVAEYQKMNEERMEIATAKDKGMLPRFRGRRMALAPEELREAQKAFGMRSAADGDVRLPRHVYDSVRIRSKPGQFQPVGPDFPHTVELDVNYAIEECHILSDKQVGRHI